MARTEEGEFELVLGNKQLLSVFFIIVILLGVFFTMGYIVGRNSGPVSASTDRTSAPVPSAPRTDSPSSMPKTQPSATEQPVAAETQTSAAAEPSKATESETVKSGEKPLEVPAVKSGSPKVVNPEPGQMFIQVSSMLAQAEAEIMVDVLGKKGFRAVIAPGPNADKYRVLVGPLQDASDAGRVKGELEQAGFKGAFVKKY